MKKLLKKFSYLIPAISLALPLLANAAVGGLPTGQAVTFGELDHLMGILANFVITIAGLLMIGSIVGSGIMIMASRDNPDA
ncbi:MAG TPA: hypothetical protein VFK07_00525, partial [Candidatus Paceibacterota bacterium]|nr:hypothetical protein [Candidatus Paceibacterota bacterium]